MSGSLVTDGLVEGKKKRPFQDGLFFSAFFYTEVTFGLIMGCIETRQGTGSGVSVKTMNVLAIIKAQKTKTQLRKEAHKAFLVYRGVPYTKSM